MPTGNPTSPEIPLLNHKYYNKPTVFEPENLLREARRQKGLSSDAVPQVCILDPDGDIVKYVINQYNAKAHNGWACYHTCLYEFEYEGIQLGVIGQAVGASFAVLLAEQLFVSGCQLLISITSAGQLVPAGPTPYFVFIQQAVRDEGTSYHYLPPSVFSYILPELEAQVSKVVANSSVRIIPGSSWTTDAPYRETQESIDHYISEGILAVEMEAAALYAFAQAKQKRIVCFAHVTNQMASIEGDFEKGEHEGSAEALKVIKHTILACS